MMRRRALVAALSCALLLAGCAGLLGVEPLSGDDGGSGAGSDADIADRGSVSDDAADAATDTVTDASGDGATCAPVWVDATGGYVPPGAVPGEPPGDTGVSIYVCHTAVGNDVIPGKLLPAYGCYYGNGDAEALAGDYQVLVPVGCSIGWRAAPGGVVPANVFACGQDSQGVLYSCRVEQPSTYIGELGHMGWGTNHQCVYSYAGSSLSTDVFDVLTLN